VALSYGGYEPSHQCVWYDDYGHANYRPPQWRNYGRQWRQSPPGAPGKGAPRADSNVFFILFNYKILSRFVAATDTALNTLRPIRQCFTANNNQLGL